MIYLDNAATTGKKPRSVIEAVDRALSTLSANPGRSGHKPSVEAGLMVYEVRKKAAELFGCEPTEVVFTANCTTALNIVIKGTLSSGDHAVVSSLEHNAVMRPLYKISAENGVEYDAAQVIFGDPASTVRSFEKLIKPTTKLVVCTHASNVTGEVLPVCEIAELCRERGVLFALDAAQSAGVMDIDLSKIPADFLCVAPHKGLYAPMGTGMLIARRPLERTLIEGGTGSFSNSLRQPDDLPEALESGTLNVPGIAGVGAGIDFVKSIGLKKIYSHELSLTAALYDELYNMPRVRLYTARPKIGSFAPVLSFNIEEKTSMQVADILAENGIAVRAGLHCAPLAHKSIGTIDTGTVRVCPSVFNTKNDISALVSVIKKYAIR